MQDLQSYLNRLSILNVERSIVNFFFKLELIWVFYSIVTTSDVTTIAPIQAFRYVSIINKMTKKSGET